MPINGYCYSVCVGVRVCVQEQFSLIYTPVFAEGAGTLYIGLVAFGKQELLIVLCTICQIILRVFDILLSKLSSLSQGKDLK